MSSEIPIIHCTATTIILRPFVRDYPGEPVPEETFTHLPSWSWSNHYQLLPSTTIHSILPVQIASLARAIIQCTCLKMFISYTSATTATTTNLQFSKTDPLLKLLHYAWILKSSHKQVPLRLLYHEARQTAQPAASECWRHQLFIQASKFTSTCSNLPQLITVFS